MSAQHTAPQSNSSPAKHNQSPPLFTYAQKPAHTNQYFSHAQSVEFLSKEQAYQATKRDQERMSPVPAKPFDIKKHQPPRVDIFGFNLLPKKKPQIVQQNQEQQQLPSSKRSLRSTNNLQSRRHTAAAVSTTEQFQEPTTTTSATILSPRNLKIPEWWAGTSKRQVATSGGNTNGSQTERICEDDGMPYTRTKIMEQRQVLMKPEQLTDDKMFELTSKIKGKKYIRHNGLTVVYPPPPPEKISPKNLETFYNSFRDTKVLMASPKESRIIEANVSMEESFVDDDLLGQTTQSIQDFGQSKSPRITSIKQIKEIEKKEARLKVNLTAEGTIHKDLTKDPGTKFFRNPSVPSNTILQQNRFDERHATALYFEGFVGVHQEGPYRLKQREDARLRQRGNQSPGKTIGEIIDDRKKDILVSLTQKYGREFQGINGYKPKFNDEVDTKKWWSYQSGFKEDPRWNSRVEMKEKRRHHAKPDQLLIFNYQDQTSTSPPPKMPFKEEHVVKESRQHLIQDKVQRTKFWKYPKNNGQDPASVNEVEGGDTVIPGYKFKKGFAEVLNPFQFKPNQRFTDKVLNHAENLANIEEQRTQHDQTWKKEEQLNMEKQLIKKQASVYRADNSSSNLASMQGLNNTRSVVNLNSKQQVHGLNRPKYNLRTEAGRRPAISKTSPRLIQMEDQAELQQSSVQYFDNNTDSHNNLHSNHNSNFASRPLLEQSLSNIQLSNLLMSQSHKVVKHNQLNTIRSAETFPSISLPSKHNSSSHNIHIHDNSVMNVTFGSTKNQSLLQRVGQKSPLGAMVPAQGGKTQKNLKKMDSFAQSFEGATTTGSQSTKNIQRQPSNRNNDPLLSNSVSSFRETAHRGVFSGIGALTARNH